VKAVLLGGSGFIGSHLAAALLRAGYDVSVYDQRLPLPGARQDAARYALGDLFDPDPPGLEALLRGAGPVFHLAWRSLPVESNQRAIADVEHNLIGSLRLLEACVQARVSRVIFFSSGGSVYGPAQSLPISEVHPTEPRSAHAINKLAVEKYLELFRQLHGLDYVILRPSNPFGPFQNPDGGQGVIAAFLARAAAGRPLEVWGDGSVVRDYLYVSDLAQAAILAASTPNSATVYNVGSGIGRSLCDVLAAIRELVASPATRGVSQRRAGVTRQELQVCWLPARPVDVPANVLDASKANRLLGWKPAVSFDAGLRLTWDAGQGPA
jgi:UDP-glucose 4-epimerase